MHIVVLLLAFLQISPLAPPPLRSAEKASIEGLVLRSGSGEPLSAAELKLTRELSEEERGNYVFFGGSPENDGLPPVITDSDGKFLLKDLEPGRYQLTAYRNGFTEQAYGSKGPSSAGTIINLVAGEKMANVTFRLVPAGVITGRVRDTAGQPVAGFDVTLLKASYSSERPYLFPADSTRTDDRGEYRLYWIPAGQYYVRIARSGQDCFRQRRVVADRTAPAAAFYPGVLDIASASMLDLAPGAELGGIDIVLPRASGNRIRGRLVDASTGKPPESASVGLSRKQREEFELGFDAYEPQYNPRTGEFEIRGVPPGSYTLAASAQPKFDAPISPEQLAGVRTGADIFETMFSSASSAQIAIDVSGTDLEDVVLVLKKGVSIPVRVHVEGAELSSLKGVEDIRVTLAPEVPGPYRQGSRLNAEGVARIDNVTPGEYRIQVDYPPSTNVYVKEIVYGRSTVLAAPIEITDQAASPITVLLSTYGGRVEGRLTNAVSEPVSGVEVVLIPDDRSSRLRTRTAVTDRDGRFDFRAVAPGGYKLYAWEELQEGEYHNKQILSKYESQGRPVRVQESSRETFELRIIPPLK